jgi:hypothetical protein
VINLRLLALPLKRLLTEILLPGLLAYPLAGLLRLAWDLFVPLGAGRWETLACLGLFGTLYLAALALTCWTWLLTRAERLHLVELGGKLFGRLPQWKST